MRKTFKDTFPEIPSLLKEVLAVMFATPASLGILAQVSEKIDLGEVVERIVLNYRLVAKSIVDLVEQYLSVEFPFSPEVAFVTVFVTMQILTGSLLATDKRPTAERRLNWGWVSQICLLSFGVLFGIEGELDGAAKSFLFVALSAFALLPLLLVLFYLISTVSFLVRLTWRGEATLPSGTPSLSQCLFSIGLLAVSSYFLTLLSGSVFHHGFLENLSLISWFLYLFVLFLICGRYNLKSPAYVTLWSLGIAILSWITGQFIPNIEAWLDHIGA